MILSYCLKSKAQNRSRQHLRKKSKPGLGEPPAEEKLPLNLKNYKSLNSSKISEFSQVLMYVNGTNSTQPANAIPQPRQLCPPKKLLTELPKQVNCLKIREI
ncbi:hypothetical protein V6N13_045034 [Hibiscus sabdariffa]